MIERSGENHVPRITSSTTASASSLSQYLPGVRARKLTLGANSALRAAASWAATVSGESLTEVSWHRLSSLSVCAWSVSN